jgi:hypothetical protein
MAYLFKARIVVSQQSAVTRQRPVNNRRMMFCVQFMLDSCTCNNGICHAIIKQELHCNRRVAFST